MTRKLLLPGAIALLGLVALGSACAPPVTGSGGPSLTITLAPSARLAPDGTKLNVQLAAVDSTGKAGTGTVTLSVGAGSLGGAAVTGTVALVNGVGLITYACNAGSDAACTGTVKIAANWNAVKAVSAVQLVVPGEIPDGGNKVPDAGTPDGGITPTGVPAQLTFVNTACNGVTGCSVMGVKGSGFNEQAQVFFKLLDSAGKPVADYPVAFSLINQPTGTVVSGSGVSDANGFVSALITSGQIIGATAVYAQASISVSATSSTIGIRGGKPANKAFLLQCTPVNIATYVAATPPAIISVPCTVALLDRFNNPVGTGTAVYFKTETGNISNSVNTQAFVPGQTSGEGTAVVPFSTNSQVYLPTDVAPLEADPAQYPYPLTTEPRSSSGPVINNPRDSLVTILAYVSGEEYFEDKNNNGVYDLGETFIDQGEPFVDNNDNGVWDPGEFWLDVNGNGNVNGVWDPPNGVYDSNTTIWTEAKVLYTGLAVPANSFITPGANSGVCNAGVPLNSFADLGVTFLDSFYNDVVGGSSIGVAGSGPKGSVSMNGPTSTLDTYGFQMTRNLVNATNGLACTAATPICQWRTLFGTWKPLTSVVRLTGMTADDGMGCKNNTLTVTITEKTIPTQIAVTVGVH